MQVHKLQKYNGPVHINCSVNTWVSYLITDIIIYSNCPCSETSWISVNIYSAKQNESHLFQIHAH